MFKRFTHYHFSPQKKSDIYLVISFVFTIFAVAYMSKGKIIIIPKLSKAALEWLKVGKERGFAFEADTIYVPFQSSQPSSERGGRTKPGAKETRFADFLINSDEADWIINFLKKNIDKNRPRQAALWVMAAIEAGKVSLNVTSPSIEREFGVKGNSVKPHLNKYRSELGRKGYKSVLEPYVAILTKQGLDQEQTLKNAS